ncbi:M16 family metallopeptidase [Streptomyces orinoci]|uniref:Insulinase family protein n=1 Tax=Streptomyces orinoci TaxID=67339 RepID=A0ABV3JQK4_STRON|nr:insulinase family protein [Streptomyces orinoci]
MTTAAPLRRTLPGGLRLVALDRPGTRLAALALRIPVGSAGEGPREQGLAHVLEHLVVRCSLGGAADRVAAATSREYTLYKALVRHHDIVATATLLAAAFAPLCVTEAELADELATIRTERAQRTADPRWRLQEALFAALWEGTGHAHPTLGDPGVLARCTPALVRDLHAAWYRPQDATLLLVTDRPERHADAIAEAAAGLPRPAAPGPRPVAGRPGRDLVERPVMAQVPAGNRQAVGFAFTRPPEPGAAAPEALARRVVRTAGGLDIQHLELRDRSCTWIMVAANGPRQAAVAVARALAGVHDTLLGADGPYRLRTDALVPELRSAHAVQAMADRAVWLGADAALAWPARLTAVTAPEAARCVARWSGQLDSCGDGPEQS